jgi:phenylpyruvate tautomerase
MPYLNVKTNRQMDGCSRGCIERELLKELSQLLQETLGKPEQYVMVSAELGVPMLFSGTAEPAAFIELKSIGFDSSKAQEISQKLCGIVQRLLEVPPQRIYIEFTRAEGSMWGWNGGTF